jgi:magnesium chelatase subunit D
MVLMIWRMSEAPPTQPPDQLFAPGQLFPLKQALPTVFSRSPQAQRGRRSQTEASHQGGHAIRAAIPQHEVRDIALEATLRAMALRKARWSTAQVGEPERLVSPADLRIKVRRARTGNLILFVVDASASMGARKRMIAVKGAILSLLLEAYQKRDRVGLITFRGQDAQLLVPPTNSVELAERQLRHLPTGGRTPLAAGLQLAGQTLTHHLQRENALAPLLVLVTDGRANVGLPDHLRQAALDLAHQPIASLILDSEEGFVRLGLARDLATWLGAEYLPLDHLTAETISRQVRRRLKAR